MIWFILQMDLGQGCGWVAYNSVWRADFVYLLPTPCYWWLKISLSGSMYSKEIRNPNATNQGPPPKLYCFIMSTGKFISPRVEPVNLLFKQILGWCWCYWFWVHSLRVNRTKFVSFCHSSQMFPPPALIYFLIVLSSKFSFNLSVSPISSVFVSHSVHYMIITNILI